MGNSIDNAAARPSAAGEDLSYHQRHMADLDRIKQRLAAIKIPHVEDLNPIEASNTATKADELSMGAQVVLGVGSFAKKAVTTVVGAVYEAFHYTVDTQLGSDVANDLDNAKDSTFRVLDSFDRRASVTLSGKYPGWDPNGRSSMGASNREIMNELDNHGKNMSNFINGAVQRFFRGRAEKHGL